MAFHIHDDLLDNGPQYLKDNCDCITICDGDPILVYTDARNGPGGSPAGLMIGEATGLTSSEFTVADGDISGRKVTHDPLVDVEILTTGDMDHLAYLDTGNTKVLMVKPITSRAVLDGDFVTVPSSKLESRDPSLIVS